MHLNIGVPVLATLFLERKTMSTTPEQSMQTLNLVKEITIEAPVEIAFEAILAEMGPESTMMDGQPFPMVLEPWPGGRWFRNLGEGVGHLWGHVQVIKPPRLLEISGPLFMSYPAMNHVQYRLIPDGGRTTLKFAHRAVGLIEKEHREGVSEGWEFMLGRIPGIAARMKAERSRA
jgi:uncharacterized protein YndB with AHSA1/START domain